MEKSVECQSLQQIKSCGEARSTADIEQRHGTALLNGTNHRGRETFLCVGGREMI